MFGHNEGSNKKKTPSPIAATAAAPTAKMPIINDDSNNHINVITCIGRSVDVGRLKNVFIEVVKMNMYLLDVWHRLVACCQHC